MFTPTTKLSEHPKMPRVGEVIADRYHLMEQLGEGSYGVAYCADDVEDLSSVALKVLDPDKCAHPLFTNSLLSELERCTALKHEATARLLSYGTTDLGCIYAVYELVQGRRLDEWLPEIGCFDEATVKTITRQLLASLSEAHALGILHFDLRPSNIILVEPDGDEAEEPLGPRVKLLDYGLIKAFMDLSRTTGQIGVNLSTTSYAAPEILRNKDVTQAADLYALGLVMREMLSGTPVVRADSLADAIMQQMSPDSFRLPPQLLKTSIAQVLVRSALKSPRDRYQSTEEMLKELDPTTPQLFASQAPLETSLPSIGELVAERYRIRRLLGKGGWARVYLATDERAGGELALKIIDPTKRPSAKVSDRFRQEVMVCRRLKHHNTIKIWDVGSTGSGLLFMAMEYIDGLPLNKLIEKEGPFSQERTVRITRQILRSLAEAHEHGVIHRDLKPPNIMVTHLPGEPDYVKVLDFGIAKALKPDMSMVQTRAGIILCTPTHAAPELIRQSEIVPATDLYSVGLMMIEMLTAEPAIKGDDIAALAKVQIGPEPIPIPDRIAHLPLTHVIKKAIEKKLANRYRSAEEMLDALAMIEASDKLQHSLEYRVAMAGETSFDMEAMDTLIEEPDNPSGETHPEQPESAEPHLETPTPSLSTAEIAQPDDSRDGNWFGRFFKRK